MVKNIEPQKKDEKTEQNKSKTTQDHLKEYQKKHEKGSYPRRIWPTDSEKHKGPKI